MACHKALMQAPRGTNAPVAESFAKMLSDKEAWSHLYNTRFSITIAGAQGRRR